GPLIWPTIEENGVTRTKKYVELSATEKIQADCDMKATNIILQGLPADIYSLEKECKLYDAFDKFTHVKGETLHNLPPEWSKFMTDVNLVKDLHTTNFDQLHAYIKQHELHANEVHLMRERNQDPLTLVANHHMTPPHFNTYRSSYNNPQLQQQFPPSQYSQMNHQTSSVIQIAYQSSQVPTQSMNESPLVYSGLVVPVFSPGDDPIACLNKAMAFLTVGHSAISLGETRAKLFWSGYKSNATSSGETMQMDKQGLLNATTVKVKDIWLGNALSLCDQGMQHDPGQGFQTVKLFRQSFKTMLLFRLRILILMILTVMVSRMHKRFSWPIFPSMVLTLSQRLSEDFGKRFTLQQELLAEQAFWMCMSNLTSKSSDTSPVKIEATKELPKVSLVNESLKTLKFHLARFNNVVKIRTTPDARIKGEWGFEHTKAVFNNEIIPFLKSLKDIFNVFDKDLLNEIMEVQTVFDQMDVAVQQSSIDKQSIMSSALSTITYTSVYTDSEPDRASGRPLMMGIEGAFPWFHSYIDTMELPFRPVGSLAYHHQITYEACRIYRSRSSSGTRSSVAMYITESDLEEDLEEYEDDETEDDSVDLHMDGEMMEMLMTRLPYYPSNRRVERLTGQIPTPSQPISLSTTLAGERLASLIDAVTAALPSPLLPPPLYIPPPVDRRDDIPESEQPPRKRLCLSTLGSRYEIGESSTARPNGGRGIYYGFVNTVDAEERGQGIRDVRYGIRDTWIDPAETVLEVAPMTMGEVNNRVTELAKLYEHDTQDLYALLEDA
ncbi:hypothetical protein Tco_0573660, partial [Tanacetum coccineum]